MRRKATIPLALALVVIALGIPLFTGVFPPHAPAAWNHVHTGMSRSEILSLLGTPQQSGWPEKILETWQTSGLISIPRLCIIYDGERVQHVWEGTWVRGYGWSRQRRQSLGAQKGLTIASSEQEAASTLG